MTMTRTQEAAGSATPGRSDAGTSYIPTPDEPHSNSSAPDTPIDEAISKDPRVVHFKEEVMNGYPPSYLMNTEAKRRSLNSFFKRKIQFPTSTEVEDFLDKAKLSSIPTGSASYHIPNNDTLFQEYGDKKYKCRTLSSRPDSQHTRLFSVELSQDNEPFFVSVLNGPLKHEQQFQTCEAQKGNRLPKREHTYVTFDDGNKVDELRVTLEQGNRKQTTLAARSAGDETVVLVVRPGLENPVFYSRAPHNGPLEVKVWSHEGEPLFLMKQHNGTWEGETYDARILAECERWTALPDNDHTDGMQSPLLGTGPTTGGEDDFFTAGGQWTNGPVETGIRAAVKASHLWADDTGLPTIADFTSGSPTSLRLAHPAPRMSRGSVINRGSRNQIIVDSGVWNFGGQFSNDGDDNVIIQTRGTFAVAEDLRAWGDTIKNIATNLANLAHWIR